MTAEALLNNNYNSDKYKMADWPFGDTYYMVINSMEEYAQLKAEQELKRLYDWLMDENREPAQTFFTAGELRNVAKEMEFKLHKAEQEVKEFIQILREEFLVNTQNYPKEYHSLFNEKLNRSEELFKLYKDATAKV